jgi:hypothetical protein
MAGMHNMLLGIGNYSLQMPPLTLSRSEYGESIVTSVVSVYFYTDGLVDILDDSPITRPWVYRADPTLFRFRCTQSSGNPVSGVSTYGK